MSRFNKQTTPMVGPRSAVQTTDERVRTFEGALGYQRTAKSELFLLAASFMGGDDNFYEKSDDRYNRLVSLVQSDEVVSDPDWVYNLVYWLRHDGNMRTVPMVIALEYVNHRVKHDLTEPFGAISGEMTNRTIVNAALNRADEPAEALAYWLAKHGKPIPQPIKNGVADAAVRLYNEYSFLKYGESRSAALTMRDVLRLTHPNPKDEDQSVLFEYITSKDRPATVKMLSRRLPMIRSRVQLYNVEKDSRRSFMRGQSEFFKEAGMTWENVSEWVPGGMDGEAWDAAIPNMGIMALIRNLRNFDQAGISRESARYVEEQIRNADVVRKSRQLPFRWYNAYRSVESVRWSTALDEALAYSLANVPKLRGNTLVLVDMSGSMFQTTMSPKSNVTYADAAALFGTALKLANPHGVELYQFGSEFSEVSASLGYGYGYGGARRGYQDHLGNLYMDYGPDKRWNGCTKKLELRAGGSVLRGMEKFHDMGGTEIHKSVAETVRDYHDRVILITDEQAYRSNYDELPVPNGTNVYIWNLAGYSGAVSKVGKYHRHAFGGLSDSAFRLIPVLEAGRNASWPWTA